MFSTLLSHLLLRYGISVVQLQRPSGYLSWPYYCQLPSMRKVLSTETTSVSSAEGDNVFVHFSGISGVHPSVGYILIRILAEYEFISMKSMIHNRHSGLD